MLKNNGLAALLALILSAVWTSPVAAQVPRGFRTGSIQGQAADARSLVPVSGVTVAIPMLELETTSDADGEFLLSGVPVGSYTLEFAEGCGCVGSVAQLLIGLTVGTATEITQDGSAIQGTLTSPWTAELCDFTGTVGSESLSAEATGCVIEKTPDMECPNGDRRDLYWSSTTLQATAFGNDMNGTLIETWDCFKTGSGEPRGSLVLQGLVEQERG